MTGQTNDIAGRTRLTEAERQTILDQLDADESRNPTKNKRQAPRAGFRKHGIGVRIHHPGGSSATSLVSTRNLSAGGLSFLYQGFLHRRTRVELTLKRRLGGEDLITGSVQHCEFIGRGIHLVGVRFDSKILPKLYLDPNEWSVLDDDVRFATNTLSGTLLHVDGQEVDRMLLSHFLKGTQIQVISAANLAEAQARLQETPVDGILCELVLSTGSGVDAIKTFRKEGFRGPIGLITAETASKKIMEAQNAGAGTVLSKPYDAAKLIALLGTWLTAGASSEAPIYSTMSAEAPMAVLIEKYVTHARTMGKNLRKLMDADDLQGVRGVCQSIKGSASGFGFAQLAETAADAVNCLDACGSIQQTIGELRHLEMACLRLAHRPPTTAAKGAAAAKPATAADAPAKAVA